nr:helix-turn-helix transcriptional regulator [Sphingomonas yantingensis]
MPKLTARQHDCMRLASKGKTNKEIAYDLGLSIKTVDGYVDGAKTGLGVIYRRHAVAKYQELFENASPGESNPVEGNSSSPVPEPQQPAVEAPAGRGMEWLTMLLRLTVILGLTLLLTGGLSLGAQWAVYSIAYYNAVRSPLTGENR